MGCFAFLEEIFSRIQRKSTERLQIHQPSLSLSPEPHPALTEDEILKQLRQEGIVPGNCARGGVSFSVPVEDGVTPRRKPPRRLEGLRGPSRLEAVGLNQYSAEERQIMADVYRYDRYVEQAQKKALERDYKRFDVKKERERRQFMKKMSTQQKLHEREEKLGRLGEEKDQAQKKALEKVCKRFDVKKESERRQFMKKMSTQQKLHEREGARRNRGRRRGRRRRRRLPTSRERVERRR